MLILLSPSKTLEFSGQKYQHATNPEFFMQTLELIKKLKKLAVKDIAKLMDISDKLAQLNYKRFQSFSPMQNQENASPAIYSFKGDVYDGFAVDSMSEDDINYAGKYLRILSGLYGLLRPMDLIQPYRLEMGTALSIGKFKNLYQFWGDQIALKLNQEKQDIIVNLASNEYFKSVRQKTLKSKLVTPIFKEKRGQEYKIIMLYAKQARGMMANFIIRNKITKIENLKEFSLGNFQFNAKLSKGNEFVFVR